MHSFSNAQSVKVSTRKVRLVADAIRNMSAEEALKSLQVTQKHGAFVLIKALKSAMANAVANDKLAVENLVISRLEVNEGPFLKRFHASTRGRIHGYKKRTSHIRIVLKEKEVKKTAVIAKVEKKEEAK